MQHGYYLFQRFSLPPSHTLNYKTYIYPPHPPHAALVFTNAI